MSMEYVWAISNHGAEIDFPDGLTLIVADCVWCTFLARSNNEAESAHSEAPEELMMIVYGVLFRKEQQ